MRWVDNVREDPHFSGVKTMRLRPWIATETFYGGGGRISSPVAPTEQVGGD